jgi:hypothetical protein
LLDQARAKHASDDWERALELLNESLKLDADSMSGTKLRQTLTELLVTEKANRRVTRRVLITAACGMVLLTGLIFGVFKLEGARTRHQAHQKALIDEVEVLLRRGDQSIEAEKFAQAKASFRQALGRLSDIDQPPSALRARLEEALASEPITKGANGLVPLDGAWMLPGEREAILGKRGKFREDVRSLVLLIESHLQGKLQSVPPLRDPEQRAAHRDILAAARQIQKSLAAGQFDEASQAYELTMAKCKGLFEAAGLVNHKGRWMTAAQATEQTMLARGYIKYNGQWVTKQEKFEAEQRSKGLVKYGGKWMTAAERDKSGVKSFALVPRLLSKRYNKQDYQNYIWFDISWDTSWLAKPTRAVKGTLIVTDLFDEEKLRVTWTITETLQPRVPYVERGMGFSYNQFIASHKWVQNTDPKDMKLKFETKSVIYLDGTQVEFTHDD